MVTELVVALERMRGDDDVADARVVGQDDIDRRQGPTSASALVEDVGDGLGSEGVTAVRLGDGGLELGRAVPVEQVQEPAGGAAEVATVACDLSKERERARATCREPVAPAMIASVALFAGERREVR